MFPEEDKKTRYRKPSHLERFMLDLFLNGMYTDPHSEEKTSLWICDILRPKDGSHMYAASWNNTPSGILEVYKERCRGEEGYSEPSKDTVYRLLKKMEKAGFLVSVKSTESVKPEKKFYPNETTDGYLGLIRYVMKDYIQHFYPNEIDPLYSRYSQRVLNRQFVMDCLRKNTEAIRILYNGRLVEVPLLGHYTKNHESLEDVMRFRDFAKVVEDILGDESVTTYDDIREFIQGQGEEFPDDPYYKITPEKRKENLVFIRRLINGLEEEIDYLKKMHQRSVRNGLDLVQNFQVRGFDEYTEHVKRLGGSSLFDRSTDVLGYSWYRDEAVWKDIVLDESEFETLEKIDAEFSEYYKEWIEGHIIMPILCLIKTFHSALLSFVLLTVMTPISKILEYSGYDQCKLRKGPIEMIRTGEDPDTEVSKFKMREKSFNTMLAVLVQASLANYFTNLQRNTRYKSVHTDLNDIQLSHVGMSCFDFTDDDMRFQAPAVFTFHVSKSYSIAIFYSECTDYSINKELISSGFDLPESKRYDWSPAVGVPYRKSRLPSMRLCELFSLIMGSYTMDDFCLANLIKNAILEGHL